MEIDFRRDFLGDKTADQDIREYGNYDGIGAASSTIFGSNFDRLVEIKTKYDPGNLFNKGYGFKPAGGTAAPAPVEPAKPAVQHVRFKGYTRPAS
ncbi:MAG: hypothetical protein Q9164_002048 [Protoblastenia rupestris]